MMLIWILSQLTWIKDIQEEHTLFVLLPYNGSSD